jgi:hypothetical protein
VLCGIGRPVGLDDDDRQRVRHDVVDVASDGETLALGHQLVALLAVASQRFIRLTEPQQGAFSSAYQVTEQPKDTEEHREGHAQPGRGPRVALGGVPAPRPEDAGQQPGADRRGADPPVSDVRRDRVADERRDDVSGQRRTEDGELEQRHRDGPAEDGRRPTASNRRRPR